MQVLVPILPGVYEYLQDEDMDFEWLIQFLKRRDKYDFIDSSKLYLELANIWILAEIRDHDTEWSIVLVLRFQFHLQFQIDIERGLPVVEFYFDEENVS
jgi:hypothetical protein